MHEIPRRLPSGPIQYMGMQVACVMHAGKEDNYKKKIIDIKK